MPAAHAMPFAAACAPLTPREFLRLPLRRHFDYRFDYRFHYFIDVARFSADFFHFSFDFLRH
jgi:hypothetical protein